MVENESSFTSLGSVFLSHPWLLFELLTFLLLATMLLGYSDFDAELKLVTRGLVVFSLWTFVIGGVHVLAIERNERVKLHWALAHSFSVSRFILLSIFLYWMWFQGLLTSEI